MTKKELLSQIESKINDMFPNTDDGLFDQSLYGLTRKEANDNYERYLLENNEKPSLSLYINFLSETIFKRAISVSMTEIIYFLDENSLLKVDD